MITLTYEDIDYEYNENETVRSELDINVEPIYEDQRFDAHCESGALKTYGNVNALSDFKFISAELFIPKYNKVIILSELDQVNNLGVTKNDILESLQGREA